MIELESVNQYYRMLVAEREQETSSYSNQISTSTHKQHIASVYLLYNSV